MSSQNLFYFIIFPTVPLHTFLKIQCHTYDENGVMVNRPAARPKMLTEEVVKQQKNYNGMGEKTKQCAQANKTMRFSKSELIFMAIQSNRPVRTPPVSDHFSKITK